MRNKHLYLGLIPEEMMYPSSILEGKIKPIYRNDIQKEITIDIGFSQATAYALQWGVISSNYRQTWLPN